MGSLRRQQEAGKTPRTGIKCEANTHTKLEELKTPKLSIIGGKDCEGVTETPSHQSTFKIGNIDVEAVHTPCHTQDSICWYMRDGDEKAVFTGDTLFIGGMCLA